MQITSLFKKGTIIVWLLLPIFLMAQEPSNTTSHSFFMAGHKFTGIIGENGQILWDSEKPHARDGYVLKNGNILICWADEVREYNKKKEVVFSYKKAEESMELGTAVRLPGGRRLITESGTSPKIVEVDKNGNVVKSVPLKPETDNVHMQTRMARKLKNGNYLVPHLLAFAVKEYGPDGTVVNVFNTDKISAEGRKAETWPFTAIRLKNGNTVVTLTHGNTVVELDPKGEVVWKLTNDDLEGEPLADPCGAQRLPNGNTVIASYAAKGPIKLLEVDSDKNMVWNYTGHNVHHFQILTTNGKPLRGAPLK